MSTPYELDIAMQPEAVLAQINNPLPEALRQLKLSDYDPDCTDWNGVL